ncbi:protein PFC0760c-like [Mya arenaria]|uniref:protein PFC0760c-like n=1 Tax=Mya arenaria TaxID=6604 RepID=UPI0022E55F8F|nr:protein PFC0760c-like [Mya arenaria]
MFSWSCYFVCVFSLIGQHVCAKKVCDVRVWYLNIVTDGVFNRELNRDQQRMRNSIDNLVLNSANGIEQRMIDCTVIQMYNDMLKEKFDYTPSTSGMVMEESESDENPTEGNEQTTNADGGVLNDDKLVDSSESVVDMVDNKNQEVVVQVKMNHKSDINEEIEKGLDINNQENTQYNNESDEAIGKEYEENTLVEDIDEINNDLPAAGDFDDLGEYDYADIGSDLDDTEFIDDDSDIKQTRDERQRHAEKDGKRLLPVGVCYAFGCALTDVFSNYHDADNDMERENIPKTDTGVLVQGTENQDNTNLKMETRRYSVSSDTHKVLDNELAHNENDVDPSDENDKGNDLHDVDIEGDRTFLNDNKEETSNKENDILNEEEIKPSFSPTSDSNLNYDQPFDSTLLPNPDEQNGIDVNKEMLQEDGHLDSKINNEKNSVQLEQIKEKILNIEGYDVKHSTQRDESKSAFDSVNVEKMIEEKTNNYFKKLQSIEILIMKLENQLLLESLNKQNHSSTITRLENHILRLENELLKMSKTYHDLKEEAEHLSQRQNKYLELAYKEQAKKSASEIADKSDKSLELISHHQSRIKELAEVLGNQSRLIIQMKNSYDYLEQQNKMLNQLVINQTVFMTSVVQTIKDLTDQNVKSRQEINELKELVKANVNINTDEIISDNIDTKHDDQGIINRLNSYMFDNKFSNAPNNQDISERQNKAIGFADSKLHLIKVLPPKIKDWCSYMQIDACPICLYNSIMLSSCLPFSIISWGTCEWPLYNEENENTFTENPAVPGVHDSKNDNNSEMSDTSNEINDQVENQRYGSEFSDKSYAKTGNGIEDGENDITNSVDNAMALDKSNDRDQIQPNDSKFPDKPDVKTETDIKDDENDIIDVVSNTIAPDKGNYQDQDQPNDSDFPDKSDFITKYGIKGDENDKNDIVGNTITPVKTDDRDQIQSDSEFQDKSDVKIKTENKGDEKAKNDIVGNTITPVKTDDRDQIQSDSEFQDKPDIKTKNHENDKIDVLGNNIASPSEPSHRNKEAQSIDTPEGTNDVSGLRYGKNKPENEHTSSSSSREKNADTDSITGGAKIDIASIDNADLLNELQKYKFVGYDKEGKPVFRLKEEAKQLKDTIIHAAEGKLLNGKENDKAKFESINENSVVQQAETNRVNDENSNGSREAETNLTKNTKTDAGQDESKQGSSQDKIDMTMNQIDTSAQDNVRIVKNRANTNEIAEETDKQVTNENEKVSRDESTQGQNEEKLPKKIDTPGTNDESQDDSKQGSLEKELTQETHKQEAFSQPEKLGEQVYEQKKTLDKTVEEKPLKHEEDKENVLTDQKNETIDAKTVAEDEQKADVKSEMKSTVSEEKDKAIKREEEKQQGKQSDKTEKMQQSEKQEKTKDKEDDSTLNKDKSKGQTGTNDTKDGRTERKKPIHIDLEKSGDSKDCYDFYVRGNRRDGLYKVRPTGIEKQVEVFCDMRRGGWTVIQRRQDGTTNFFQTWEEYKNGFGGLYGEHWLGNDNIHYLTNQDYYQLRVDLMDWDKNKKYAEFDFFLVDNEDYGYTVHVEGYTGDAGDGLTKHDGSKFSTKDVDNDKVVKEFGGSCAKRFHGAGWYYKCYASNLNGKFYKGGKIPEKRFDGVTWKPWTGPNYSLKKVEMKIRPLSAKD